jgi:hypothetical protein
MKARLWITQVCSQIWSEIKDRKGPSGQMGHTKIGSERIPMTGRLLMR